MNHNDRQLVEEAGWAQFPQDAYADLLVNRLAARLAAALDERR